MILTLNGRGRMWCGEKARYPPIMVTGTIGASASKASRITPALNGINRPVRVRPPSGKITSPPPRFKCSSAWRSSAQSRMEGQSEARIALGDGRARSQAIITRRERGDFGVYDFDQYVFPQDCALEATRTQGGRSLHVALRRPERMKIAARG